MIFKSYKVADNDFKQNLYTKITQSHSFKDIIFTLIANKIAFHISFDISKGKISRVILRSKYKTIIKYNINFQCRYCTSSKLFKIYYEIPDSDNPYAWYYEEWETEFL